MSVTYSFNEHLIEQQYAAEEAMLRELDTNHYTLTHPLVKYNLYLINPLSAVIAFDTEESVAVTVTIKGKTHFGDISHTFPKAKRHILPIVGLYSNYTNQVEIHLYRGGSNTVAIEVPDIFDGKKVLHSMDTTPEYMQDQVIMVSPSGADLAIAFDYAGDARWYINVPCVYDIRRLKNGNLIMGSNRVIELPYYMSGLYELSPVGKIYKEYRLPGGYHHDEWEMEDGNLLCLTENLRSETVEDMCVLIDRNTGKILKTWDYKVAFQKAFGDLSEDESKWFHTTGIGQSGSWSARDWFHNNAIWYDKHTDSLTFSGRHLDALINLNYETGDLNWIITDPTGWPKELKDKMAKYLFTPIGNNFGWQYEQHSCLITPNGDVMCFDNHHWGAKKADTTHQIAAKDNYSRAVRYRINTTDRTIEQIWEYGKDRGAEFFSPYISNVEFYNEGHYLVHSGGIAYDKEGNPSEALGPFAIQDGGTLEAITVEICDGKKMLEMHIPGNYYRARKLKLYSDGINLALGKGQLLGELGVTREFETDVPLESCGEILPDMHEALLADEVDRFTFHATYARGQMVMLLLEQGDEVHRYYTSTTARTFKAMCCGTFMNQDARKTRTLVNKAGLHGTYDIRVIVDDKKYETGVQVTC